MTTQNSTACPACGLPWSLIAGAFPLHTSQGEQCPMSNLEPASWPLPTTSSGTLLANPEAEELLDALSDLAADAEEMDAKEAAIKEPGRKVRSDKGTKRGQRKKGGLDSVPAPGPAAPILAAAPGGPPRQEPERVAARLDPPPHFDAVYDEALKRMNAEEGLVVTILGKDDPTASPFIDVRPPTKVEDWMKIPKIHSTALDSTTGDTVPKPRSAPPVYLVLPGAPPSYTDYAEACSKAEEQAEQNPGTTPYLVWEARPKDSFEKGVTRTRLGRVRKARA